MIDKGRSTVYSPLDALHVHRELGDVSDTLKHVSICNGTASTLDLVQVCRTDQRYSETSLRRRASYFTSRILSIDCFQSTQTFMQNLSVDVLHSIFDSVALIDARSDDVPRPNLLSVMQVCQAWRPLAEEKLYRSIRLDQGPYYKMHGLFINPRTHPDPFKPRNRVTMLARTLYENANLAALVRELDIRMLSNGQRCDPLMAKPCFAVLSLVPRLVYLDIDDISAYDYELLRAAIVEKSELEFLGLTSACSVDQPLFDDAFGLLRLASRLPKLKTLIYDDFTWNENTHPQNAYSILSSTLGGRLDSQPPYELPGAIFLSKLHLTAIAPLLPIHIDALTAITFPNLVDFSVTISAPSPALDFAQSLAHLLASWSTTLTQFRLSDLPVETTGTTAECSKHRQPWALAARTQLAAALRSLPHLISFSTSARFLRPAELLSIDTPWLLELFYYGLSQAEADTLASGLADTKRLPELEQLLLNSADGLDYSRVEEVCKTREIVFAEHLWGGREHNTYFSDDRFM